MGVCGSASFEIDPTKPGHDHTALEVFEKIGLTHTDINKLYKSFCRIDQDASCYIQPCEIFSYMRLEPNELNKRMFSTFDLGKSGKLNFLEYVCAMWNFLSMDTSYLGCFAFSIFDNDGSNSLDFLEVKHLIEMIQHKKYETNDGVRRLVDELRDINHEISLDQFTKFSKDNPTLCAPLVSLQFVLRQKVVGTSFWTSLARRRCKSPEQNKITYTVELCQYVFKKYEMIKFQKMVQSKEKRRVASLQRIASAKATVEDETKHRNELMLGYFHMSDPGDRSDRAKKKPVDGKTRAKLEKRMSSREKARISPGPVCSSDECEEKNDDEGDFAERKVCGKRSQKAYNLAADDGKFLQRNKLRSTIVAGSGNRLDGTGAQKSTELKSRPSSASFARSRPSMSIYSHEGSKSADMDGETHNPLRRDKSRRSKAVEGDGEVSCVGDGCDRNRLPQRKSRNSMAIGSDSMADRPIIKIQRPSSAARRQTSVRVGCSTVMDAGECGSKKKPHKLEPLAKPGPDKDGASNGESKEMEMNHQKQKKTCDREKKREKKSNG